MAISKYRYNRSGTFCLIFGTDTGTPRVTLGMLGSIAAIKNLNKRKHIEALAGNSAEAFFVALRVDDPGKNHFTRRSGMNSASPYYARYP